MAATGTSLTQFKLKPQNDAYTVLLSISLVAMIAACVLLFYDLKKYPTQFPAGSGSAAFPPANQDRFPGGPGAEPGFPQ